MKTAALFVIVVMGQSNANKLAQSKALEIFKPTEIINCAVNSSPISSWAKGQENYENCVKQLQGKKPSLIVWWQGEAEAVGETPPAAIESWPDNFSMLMHAFRLDTHSPELPVLYVRLGNIQASAGWQKMRQKQTEVSLPFSQIVDIDNIPAIPGDVHYPESSYREIAYRILDVYKELP